ncbi:uncharacterized protein EDB93DRAFT_1114116 [Suillus bovinus]|uniref:uncharacterized protein n=1 Tax=Suillus bovinus TaxID=48563 RepID=UPI001B86373A|nr:uncharacterized protein EDB93DRAFT_1114116 [Suillus bovinus]KAG2160217.1 hypothetical protein EDB93DRAFT_1114116 [Suillus bovinus]
MSVIQVTARLLSYSNYTMLVPNVILIYDHMATLTEEIVFIWCRPKALSSALFLLNRYVALLANAYALIGNFLPASAEVLHFIIHVFTWQAHDFFLQSCPTYTLSQQVLVFFQAFIICRDKRLLALLIIIILAFVGGASVSTEAFGRYPSTVTILPGGYCYQTYTAESLMPWLYSVAGLGIPWVALFFYELLIFVLTVTRIFKIRRLLRLSLMRSRRNIISVMFQDGEVMTLFNIPNILTYYDIIMGSLSTFTSCMSVTLISRLMLNLHKSIDAGILSTPTQDDDFPVLNTIIDLQSTNSSHYW